MRKKTHEEFMRDFEEKQPENFKNIEIIGEYVNTDTKIKCRCLIDGHEWEATPANLLSGTGCPKCAGNRKRYTTESFKEKLKEVNPNIEILDEYINSATKIKCRCLIDGYEWEAVPAHLLQGHSCPKCVGVERYTTESFKEKLKEVNPNIEVIGEYVNNRNKIKCRCLIDEYEWEARPHDLLKAVGCPKCAGNVKKTHEQFVEEMKEVNPNIEIIGEYINDKTKILCRCLIDGHEWEVTPHNLLRGRGCPLCGGALKKTHEQFVEELKQINPDIEVVGEYVNALTKIKCRCLIDEYEWEATPGNLLQGRGCPICAGNGESWMDRTLYEMLLEYDSDAIYRGKDTIGMELDSFCPNLNLAFEPGSWHWHQDKVERDAIKRKLCAEKGIRCITIYDSFPENIEVPFEEDCYVCPKDFGQNKEEFFEQMNKLIPKIIGGE